MFDKPIVADRVKFAKPLEVLKLYVKVRSQGSCIESVPLKRLVELSKLDFRKWSFEDGWLVLYAI